jgi:CRISPR-associated protein Cmr2
MDGDSMGAWFGDGDGRPYRNAFHPDIEAVIAQRFGDNRALQAYLEAPRAVSPARHLAISGALNAFSNVVARHVLEEAYNGRILYAGGDDLMAMLPTGEVLSAMRDLRHAYSGNRGQAGKAAQGYVHQRGRLHLTMGPRATASMGVVVAHHQTPLTAALAELRRAEQAAKTDGGRNAFCLSILKRSGGAVHHTASWEPPISEIDEVTTLEELSTALASEPNASRRAAYNMAEWLTHLPEPYALGGQEAVVEHLEAVLHHQFCRQRLEDEKHPIHSARLARLGAVTPAGEPQTTAAGVSERVTGLTDVAEFLAREARR